MRVNIRTKIREALKQLLRADFNVEHPMDESMGDYATNAALMTAAEEGKSPRKKAEEIVSELRKNEALNELMEKIEIAGPGFINFYVKDSYLFDNLVEVEKDKNGFGKSDWGEGRRVVIDYSSPNIAKRFSVGHLRSTIIGDALKRMYRFGGWEAIGDNHLGDWGTQFGMIIAAVEEKSLDVSKMTVPELEELYVEYNKRIEEEQDDQLKERAREAFLRLEKGEKGARKIWQAAKDVSMEEFDRIYQKLGVTIEKAYGESYYEPIMPKVIAMMEEKGLVSEGEGGAKIVEFKENEKDILPPAMLVKSNGTTTYFTRDMATIWFRLFGEDREMHADLYIYEVGAEQTLHLRQVFAAAIKMGWIKMGQCVHVAHGLMTLPEGKMSTRKGNTIKLEDLLERSKDKAAQMGDKEISDILAISAIKYNELKRSPQSNYIFRWEEALSMEGNSAPYVNYAFVRAKKIIDQKDIDENVLAGFNDDEKKLLRWLVRFSEGEVIQAAAKNYAPQQVCAYLFELAQRFNAFYDKNRVLGEENESQRLVLVKGVMMALKNGLAVLGIEAVEKM